MDISLEIGILDKDLRLAQNGLLGTILHAPSLMIGQSAITAFAEAPAHRRDAELDLLDRRNAARVARMIGTHIRKRIHEIHLLRGKRPLRRILHEITISVFLHEKPSRDVVAVVALKLESARVVFLIGRDLFIGRAELGFLLENFLHFIG